MTVRQIAIAAIQCFPPLSRALKHSKELQFWQARKKAEGTLSSEQYEFFYTVAFGLARAFYVGQRILDIGCGPRGSLEWADGASERIGLDPLVPNYRKLGIDRHKMSYCAAPSERIPYADGYFDVVASINSLDHVDDVNQTAKEIGRVTKAGGLFLLAVEVNHRKRICEPHDFDFSLVQKFRPAFAVAKEEHLEHDPTGLRASIQNGRPYSGNGSGVLLAMFRRNWFPH
jgi:ubiquinone/menaquinone biosynthesis C-methylase UbiE